MLLLCHFNTYPTWLSRFRHIALLFPAIASPPPRLKHRVHWVIQRGLFMASPSLESQVMAMWACSVKAVRAVGGCRESREKCGSHVGNVSNRNTRRGHRRTTSLPYLAHRVFTECQASPQRPYLTFIYLSKPFATFLLPWPWRKKKRWRLRSPESQRAVDKTRGSLVSASP